MSTPTSWWRRSRLANTQAVLVAGLRIPLGQRLTGWVGANRQTIRNSDRVLDLGESARSVSPRPRSSLSTPMVVNDALVGVLSLYSTNREAFSEDHQRVVEVVARQVGPVVQQSLKSDRTRQATFRDQLTGLPNLEQFHLFARSHTTVESAPMSLIYIDVNGLKDIGVSHGRTTEDDALNHVVLCTRRHMRPADVLFRYSTDEFVVVQFQTDKVLAAAMAARIAQAVESQPVGQFGGVKVKVTVGVSAMPDDGESLESLVSVARQRIGHTHATRTDTQGQPPESIH